MKRVLFSIFTALISIAIFAGNVTEQQALTIARQFMQGKTFQQKQVRRAAAVGFYLFKIIGRLPMPRELRQRNCPRFLLFAFKHQ